MTYGRIRRGPMAADQFTQIRNALFRDPRLSLKDKGLFGLISTHRDGWGVTPESLATCCTDGVSAIKAGLRNLERYGYLRRERERRPDGTLGASAYYITDQPDAVLTLIEEQNRRSEPKVDYPPVDEPPVDEPTVDDRTHKKTNSKKPKGKNTTPSPRPPEQPAAAADTGGGGGDASPPQDEDPRAAAFVDSLPFGGRVPTPATRAHLIGRAAAALAAGWTETALHQQLTAETSSAKSLASVYRYRLAPENLPNAPAPVPTPRAGQPSPYVCCTDCGLKMRPTPDGMCRECREDTPA